VCAAVIACCDAPPVLEFSEHVFDFMALFVERFIVFDLDFAVRFRRDAGRNTLFHERGPEPVGIIPAIRQQGFCLRQNRQQQSRALVIAHLAFGEQHDDRSSVAIANGMKFRVQAALRATDTAGNIPFFSRQAAVR
jgi:hypothetical protein